MSKESLAAPLRARRSKTIATAGSLPHFARQVPRTSKPCGRLPRAQTHAGVASRGGVSLRRESHEFRSGSERRTSQACRTAAVGSFYLVFFAPASTEQFPCSLGCEFSQVVIDCVSEADIFLLMQSQ